MTDLSKITCIEDLRVIAQRRVPRMFYDYADSGSWTEGTYRANQAEFAPILLRQRDRHRDLLPDHGGAGAAPLHVDRHPLAEPDRLEVGLVGAVGALGPAAGVGVVVEHARHPLAGQAAQVFNVGDRGHDPIVFQERQAGAGHRRQNEFYILLQNTRIFGNIRTGVSLCHMQHNQS